VQDAITSTFDGKLGPLPLAIGVTGHRDLRDQDVEGLSASVRSIFKSLQGKGDQPHPPCGEAYCYTPLVLFSFLAEGADRLVARVALDCGACLVPVLPMPTEEYAKDFPNTVEEFHALLALQEGTCDRT
jgi:hypothetical protein